MPQLSRNGKHPPYGEQLHLRRRKEAGGRHLGVPGEPSARLRAACVSLPLHNTGRVSAEEGIRRHLGGTLPIHKGVNGCGDCPVRVSMFRRFQRPAGRVAE